MSRRQPDFDIDRAAGAQAELWVSDVRKALASTARVEVKAPKPFLEKESFFVEYACRGRDGRWRKSGIANPRTAELWLVTFGALPGGLVVDGRWLLEAARHAYRNPARRRECIGGSNPTKAVLVSLRDLYVTRPFEVDGSPR